MLNRFNVDVTTDGSGAAEVYSPQFDGKIVNVIYQKDGSTPFADGVDFQITLERSGQNVWVESNVNASKSCAPRQATHSDAGVASLFAAGGTAVQDKILAVKDRLKFVIAQGGSAKLGRFVVIVE